jgi:DNA-binding NarL/FixJ family response regulator
VALAEDLNPDVVLMDISMPGIGGAEATRRIKSANPEIQVIALSSERGSEMLDAGATKYISKSRAASTIGDAIRSCCGSKIQDS